MPIPARVRVCSRPVFSLVFILVFLSLAGPALAQQKAKDQKKYDKAQTQDIQTLVKMVGDASAGQPAAADFQVTWQNHCLKARDQRTFVPYTIAIEPGKLTNPLVAMYIRAVKHGGEAPAPAPGSATAKDQKDQKDQKKIPEYAFEDIHFIDLKAELAETSKGAAGTTAALVGYRFNRALSVAPGEYDVWVAIKERAPASEKGAAPQKATVFKQALTAPDFWANELATSSIIVADKVEPLTAALPESETGSHPYTFGLTQIVPALVNKFSKKDNLSLLFLVYNSTLEWTVAPATGTFQPDEVVTGDTSKASGAIAITDKVITVKSGLFQAGETVKGATSGAVGTVNKRPDVLVEYNFNRKVDSGEKFFNSTVPQKFNAGTLPAQFDIAAGHQLVAGQEIPLTSFPEGDYRLEIKVTDKVGNKTLTQNVNFTITP